MQTPDCARESTALGSPDGQPKPVLPPNPLRRLYAWVLHWAETRWGTQALAVISFAESSFFPIPPDVLLIALCIGNVPRGYVFAAWCSVASVLGGLAGYGIGAFLWNITAVQQFFYTWVPGVDERTVAAVAQLYEQYSFCQRLESLLKRRTGMGSPCAREGRNHLAANEVFVQSIVSVGDRRSRAVNAEEAGACAAPRF